MSTVISKDNLDNIFFNLAKRIQKQLKHFNVVLYITGGANLVHGTLHRESTLDIDANLFVTLVKASSIFKEYKRVFNVSNIRLEYERLSGILGIVNMHDLAMEVADTFLN